jgi:hypothetical protein
MPSIKEIKLSQKTAAQQQQVISELNALVKDIERCEKTMTTLMAELQAVNSKYPGKRSTREDVAYLTDLLECAKKKLAWEKQIGSLQKRTPELLEKMSRLFNDPQNPPSEEIRAGMLKSLQLVQNAMERLQALKLE